MVEKILVAVYSFTRRMDLGGQSERKFLRNLKYRRKD
jgi:hypothetical protein